MKLIKLIAKDFKILLRSRSAAAIIFLGPLLIMIIAGMAFNNTSSFDLRIGILNGNENPTATKFTTALSNEYNIIDFDTIENCINSVKSSQTHACIEYPTDFVIAEGKQNKVLLHIDTSKTNIVDIISGSIRQVIGTQQQEISSDLTNVLIDNINAVATDLQDSQNTYINPAKTKLTTIGQSLTSINNDIQTINLSYNKNSIDLSGVQEQSESIDAKASQIAQESEKLWDLLDNLVDDVKDENASASLNAVATQAYNDGKVARDKISTETENLEQERDNLLGATTNAQNRLTALGSQIDSAQSKKNTITQNLATQGTEITATAESITQLSSKLEQSKARFSTIENTDVNSIVKPIIIEPQTIVSNVSRLNYIFPNLMLFVIMFVSILLASTLIIMEKRSSAQFRMFATPTHTAYNVCANVITVLIVVVVQIALVLSIAQVVFHINVTSNFVNISVILLLAACIFIFIGMLIGLLFSTEQTSLLGAISIGSLFLLVSDLILPIESMSSTMGTIMSFSPFVLASDMLRQSIIFGSSLGNLGKPLFILLSYIVLFLIILAGGYKLIHFLFFEYRPKKRDTNKAPDAI